MVRTLLGKPRTLRPLQATDTAAIASCMTDGLSEAEKPASEPWLWQSSSYHGCPLYQNKKIVGGFRNRIRNPNL